jgi:hypothetical protein
VAVSGDEEEARSLKQSLDDSAAADESDSDQEVCSNFAIVVMIICMLKLNLIFSFVKLRNK